MSEHQSEIFSCLDQTYLVDSHVSQQSLFVFSRLQSTSNPSLNTHSVHSIQNLLDSFIIARLKGNNLVYCKAGLTNRAEHSQWVPYEHQLFSKGDLIIEGGPSPQSHLVWLQRRPNIKIDGGALFLRLPPSAGLLLDERNFLFALLLVIDLQNKTGIKLQHRDFTIK